MVKFKSLKKISYNKSIIMFTFSSVLMEKITIYIIVKINMIDLEKNVKITII